MDTLFKRAFVAVTIVMVLLFCDKCTEIALGKKITPTYNDSVINDKVFKN